jgi:molybdate transport system substrate-binding protein
MFCLRLLLLLALFLPLLSGCADTAKPQVRIAAAADLKFALDDVVAEFHKLHPDVQVQTTYGASGTFFAQLSNKAPFDLFLSADVDYPRKLIEAGLADPDSEFLYAVGRLVIWAPSSSKLDAGMLALDALRDPSVRKIAIANPRHAPYGRAAEAALKKLGVYDQVKDRLVLGENIVQTAQMVESGGADVGLIALSLALSPQMKDKGRFWRVPDDAYPKLEQGGVILKDAGNPLAAGKVRDFLTSKPGRDVLGRHGFVLPGD